MEDDVGKRKGSTGFLKKVFLSERNAPHPQEKMDCTLFDPASENIREK